ncbi:methionyl-tRNA formyltransferase [Halobaculum sp. P14]|uniref:methionyl-tRNA formyltransferase n=1 Tax=Halobaculum sp. P14 TaxID=3421638 RepID=UPI003EC09BAB
MVTVAFLGSHTLGVRCLERLHEHPDVDVEIIVTYRADSDRWWEGSVRERANELGYENVLPIDSEREVLDHPVDYLISVYYPNILGPELLNHPDQAPINLHQAELPRYRGSNVFSHSIMNARKDDYWKHGTTMHFMAEDVDAGDIIDRRFVEIDEDDTARSLYERTREASEALFEDMLPHIVSGDVMEMGTPQSEFGGERYFYTKDSLDDVKQVDPEELGDPDDVELYDRIRAVDFPPFEPAYTELNGRRIYLTKTGYSQE